MYILSSAITFNHLVCCGCFDRGPGSKSSSTFASYRAVTTHIGRSYICQHEGKGVRTVTTQYVATTCRGSRGWSSGGGRGLASAIRSPAAAPGKM